ncbi:hypothetical protein [Apibacter mensalis]|uniref:hypothetical protein n=1 Tax=Apibacter mensalis TaxID=1586267 RepID=UPI0006E2F66B|nr:hypothetical protein [Apibacter mensalis]
MLGSNTDFLFFLITANVFIFEAVAEMVKIVLKGRAFFITTLWGQQRSTKDHPLKNKLHLRQTWWHR